MEVIAPFLLSATTGALLAQVAERRRTQGLSPYDRPGFPAPALWGLLGWLMTPIGLSVFLWRFDRRVWILPALAGWGAAMAGLAAFVP